MKITDDQLAQLRTSFALYDANGDGTIDKAEIHKVLLDLGISDPNSKEAGLILSELDANGDGSVSFGEFLKVVKSLDSLKEVEVDDIVEVLSKKHHKEIVPDKAVEAPVSLSVKPVHHTEKPVSLSVEVPTHHTEKPVSFSVEVPTHEHHHHEDVSLPVEVPIHHTEHHHAEKPVSVPVEVPTHEHHHHEDVSLPVEVPTHHTEKPASLPVEVPTHHTEQPASLPVEVPTHHIEHPVEEKKEVSIPAEIPTHHAEKQVPKEESTQLPVPASPPAFGSPHLFIWRYEGSQVHLAGDFTAWGAGRLPLHRSNDGSWEIEVILKPGIYEYRFIIDNNIEWYYDILQPNVLNTGSWFINNVVTV